MAAKRKKTDRRKYPLTPKGRRAISEAAKAKWKRYRWLKARGKRA